MNGHKWTNDELKTLMSLWASEVELIDICIELKMKQETVLKQVQRLRKAGIPLKQRTKGHKLGRSDKPWSQAEIAYLASRWQQGATDEDIAVESKRSLFGVRAMKAKLKLEGVGLVLRGGGRRRLWDAETLRATMLAEAV
jgi:biotin operon repressor